MITNTMLIKKLSFKKVEKKLIIELVKSEYYLKQEGCLTNEELVHLIRLQVSN